MESRRDHGPQERERLARFLAWRRVETTVPERPARRSPSYVGAVAWFAFGVLTVALVGAVQRPGRGPIGATQRPASAGVTRLLTPIEPASLTAERAATAWSAPSGRKALSAPASVRLDTAAPPVAASRLTTTVTKARRWVDHIPGVKAGKAIVRRVRSQPPPDGLPLVEPDRPQAR
jgi:hypothetical protein